RKFVEQSRYRAVKLRHLHLHIAVVRLNIADSLDSAQRIDIQVSRHREFDHMLRPDRGDQFARCSKGDHFPMVHYGDPVAEPLGFVHVMCRQQDCLTRSLELLDQLPKLTSRLWIQPGCWFIKEQKV